VPVYIVASFNRVKPGQHRFDEEGVLWNFSFALKFIRQDDAARSTPKTFVILRFRDLAISN